MNGENQFNVPEFTNFFTKQGIDKEREKEQDSDT